MNNELIKRIDEIFAMGGKFEYRLVQATKVLADCKAEIERIDLANETLKALNIEYLERVKILETELWRESKAREYVPMTDDELATATDYTEIYPSFAASCRAVERAVIERLGLKWGGE